MKRSFILMMTLLVVVGVNAQKLTSD